MATADSVKAKIQAWIDLFNKKSGRNDTTFTDALVWYLFSIEPELQTLTVTENGTYTPPNGVTGYNKVEVDVQPSLESLHATDNGYYTPSPGHSGFESVEVDVTPPQLETLYVTENGIYTPSGEVTGYSHVEVSVDTQSFYDDGYNTGYSEGYEAGRNSVETA